MTAVVALVFFAVSGALALLIRTELASTGMQLVSHDTYNQLFTLHGSGMIFLVMTPAALALGLYIVPLQVGAAEVMAPRLALAALWLLVLGGLSMFLGFATGQGAGKAGWFSYYPLSGEQGTPGTGMDMWIVGVMLATAAGTLLGLCIVGTILRLRAPGMTMLRLPVFSWSMLVSCLMVVLSFPVLIVAFGLLLAARHAGLGVYDGDGGPIIYQHLFWFFGHPVVYVMFFPFVGVALEAIAVFSGRRMFGYRAFVVSMLAFGGLSMSVWAHHMFATGQVANRYFALTSTLLIVPAGIEYLDALATMWRGAIRLTAPMLFALGFFMQFLIGGVTGIFVASPPLDFHVTDTYFVVAHFHYTLVAGSLFGLFTAIYYWAPKATGVMLDEGLGRLHFVLLVVGTNLTFFPMFLLGMDGMVRRVPDYPQHPGWEFLNRLATAGSYVIAVAILVFAVNVAVSWRRRTPAGDDPWGGQTLEWATTSPPPRHNFAALPPVRSFAPLLDARRAQEQSP